MFTIAGEDDRHLVSETVTDAFVRHGKGRLDNWSREGGEKGERRGKEGRELK